jgi:hypothetical protein
MQWVFRAALLFGGFIGGTENKEGTRRMPTWTRMASSVTLVIVAWMWSALMTFTPEIAIFSRCVAIGMTLGCIGDFFMAGLIPISQNVLGGMVSFGLGHIAYITGFLSVDNSQYVPPQPFIVVVWLIIAAVLWYVIVFRGSEKTRLHYAALPYSLLLAATAGLATMRAVQYGTVVFHAIGAALFLLSDLILATRLFNHARFHLIDDVVWLTYGPGQMLIVYGLFAFYLFFPAVPV